jgi:predicted ATPase
LPRGWQRGGAEESFRKALAVARRQHAKSLGLRAANSLSRLWQSQGRCQAAYELLAPVYGWFYDGFYHTGMLALSRDQQAKAETCFHQVLVVARHQQAKSWELRAVISLVRLRQSQSKRQ